MLSYLETGSIFTDVIKLIILRSGDHPGLSDECSYKREAERDLSTSIYVLLTLHHIIEVTEYQKEE